jgi:hypothetical protein
MTTGRINQVTTFQNHFRGHRLLAACQGHSPLSRRGVHRLLFASNVVDPSQLADTFPPTTTLGGGTSNLKPTDGVTLFPVLTRLEQDPLVP